MTKKQDTPKEATKDAPKKSLAKVIGTDIAGIICLILVPILGPLPGPGGIPLLLTGLGLLALNHDWAKKWLIYVKKHSDNIREIAFPEVTWIQWAWDIFAFVMLSTGLYFNLTAEWWFLKGLSIGIMAGATTVFMLNRNRVDKLDKILYKRKR